MPRVFQRASNSRQPPQPGIRSGRRPRPARHRFQHARIGVANSGSISSPPPPASCLEGALTTGTAALFSAFMNKFAARDHLVDHRPGAATLRANSVRDWRRRNSRRRYGSPGPSIRSGCARHQRDGAPVRSAKLPASSADILVGGTGDEVLVVGDDIPHPAVAQHRLLGLTSASSNTPSATGTGA